MIYKKDYFGFVYEWTDHSNMIKYIGSHHGSTEDSYKGSNTRFRRAIKKRPEDFKRKILEYSLIDKKEHTLSIEQKWLDSVENIKDNPEYYNQKNEASGGWSFITDEHIEKRSRKLKENHSKNGLSSCELESYKQKIETRLKRISVKGFTDKEKNQYLKYGYKIKVIDINKKEIIFDSCGAATRALGIDAQYGLKVCKENKTFRGYKIIKIRDPITDCRSLGKK